MKSKLLLKYGILTLLLHTSISYGQEVKAVLKASTTGYQHIQIPQEFTDLIGKDIGKVRIKDKNGNEVPYIQKREVIKENAFTAEKYSISKNDSTDIITIENRNKDKKLNYTLKITNTKALKNYVIEGSDDQTHWFSLVNKGILDNLESETNTYMYKTIDFPLTQYKYIRILIDNRNSSPIQVLNVGNFEVKSAGIVYEKLRNIKYKTTENKNNKTTIIEISKNGISPFNMINFHIANKFDYYRSAYLYTIETVTTTNKGVTVNSDLESRYYDLNLSSKQANIFQYNFLIDQDKFYVTITNDINTPLQIDSIELFQKPLFITANLNENDSYTLEADNNWANAMYDINKLNLNLPADLDIAQTNQIEWLKKDSLPFEKVKEEENKNNWILIIGLFIAVLATFYFGQSLIKDIKKNK